MRLQSGDYECVILFFFIGQSSSTGSMSSIGGSFIGKVLLANADALCAAATPLVESEEIHL